MQRVQRQFGKVLPRTVDESSVGQLIQDFDHAQELLGLLIKDTKTWQQSWKDILDSSERLTASFLNLAHPILTGSEDSYNGPAPVETPAHVSRRLARLHNECQALRQELEPDIQSIDSQIVKPAHQAKDSMSVMKSTIKIRDNIKLDFERYQGRRDTAFRKQNRSERDNIALAKHESDLEVAKETYDRADHGLRTTLPDLLRAIRSLIPLLLSLIIRTAHTFVANYYTMIHEFCQAESFPMPPPPASELISQWARLCKPIQSKIESIPCCMNAKRGRFGAAAPMAGSSNVSNASNSPRISPSRDDTSSTYSQDRYSRDRIQRVPSGHFQQGQALLSPGYRRNALPNPADVLTPISATSKPDYFSRDRIPSTSSATSVASSVASVAAGKKKPPPPPPKRIRADKPELWVTALYDFGGQNQGDLQMREGDKIKVLKKTDSTNDWWEGECNGMRGSFPANYCKT